MGKTLFRRQARGARGDSPSILPDLRFLVFSPSILPDLRFLEFSPSILPDIGVLWPNVLTGEKNFII